ncbi:MAG: TonB family protein [Marinifilaceae bacterium]
MNALFEYLFQSSAILTLFYLVYFFLFRNERLFTEVRLFLLSSAILALVLPLVKIPYTVLVTPSASMLDTVLTDFVTGLTYNETGSVQNSSGASVSWFLGSLYVAVCLVLSIRSIVKVIQIHQMTRGKEYEIVDGTKVFLSNDSVPAFTFFNYVVINKEEFTNESFQNILAHEKVHAQQKHWIDLLLVELLCIVFWFNPFVWLFQRAVKQTHELLADDGVIARGFNIGQYQAILINQLMGAEVLGLANNFNYSLNKKRMIMMSSEKCPQNRRYKFLVMVPAIVAILMFNLQVVQVAKAQDMEVVEISKENKVSISGKVLDMNNKPAEGVGVMFFTRKNGKSKEVGNIKTVKIVRTDKNGLFKTEVDKNSEMIIGQDEKDQLKREVEDFVLNGKKIDGAYFLNFKLKAPYTPKKKSKRKARKDNYKGEPVFVLVEEMPKFPGGYDNIQKYINEKVAKLDARYRIDEKCFVTFIITKKGEVKKARVIKSTGNSDVDAAALKIVESLPQWTPAKQRGKKVNVSYTVPVSF